jgi:lipoate-protein ligase A
VRAEEFTVKTIIVETHDTDVYRNLAREEWMLRQVPEDTMVLYLWQNASTVVLGRSQNAFAECALGALEAAGGRLSRRLSGGGAVYHDLGNLNFTFIAPQSLYNVSSQSGVILAAVRSLGIEAVRSGRNDLEVNLGTGTRGKFSGNAFCKVTRPDLRDGSACYHHGTILVHEDKNAAARFLTVSKDKIASKGVASVRARMLNLCDLVPGISIQDTRTAVRAAFIAAFGEPQLQYGDDFFDGSDARARTDLRLQSLDSLTQKYSSKAWLYGRNPPFTFRAKSRFAWGGVELLLNVEKGVITDAEIYSDAMDSDYIDCVKTALQGIEFSTQCIANALPCGRIENKDILSLLD